MTYKRNYAKKNTPIRTRDRKWRSTNLGEDYSWTKEMSTSLREFQPYCAICRSPYRLEIDHALPLSKGYALQPGNAVILCKKCNLQKSNKSLDELNEQAQLLIMDAAIRFKNHWNTLQRGDYEVEEID